MLLRRSVPNERRVRKPRPNDSSVHYLGEPQHPTYLPSHETDGFHDSWLYNFFAWENSPGYSIWAFYLSIRTKVTILLDGMINEIRILFN